MDNKITYIDLKNINPHVRISRINFLNSEFSTGYRMIYHHQMLYIYGGCGEIEVEGVCYKASKGDLFYWGPAQKHKIMSDAKKPLVILGVQFDFTRNHEDKSYLLEFTSAEHFDYGEIHEMIRFHDFEGFKPYTKVYNCSEAEKQLLEIANECKTQKRFYSERMSAIFKAFLIMIVRQTLAEPLREEEHQNLVDKVIQYIHEHYEKPLTNQEIAHIYNFHPNYINKLMVIYTGLSLHQYILRCEDE